MAYPALPCLLSADRGCGQESEQAIRLHAARPGATPIVDIVTAPTASSDARALVSERLFILSTSIHESPDTIQP